MKEQRLTFIKHSRIEKRIGHYKSKKDGRKMWFWRSVIWDLYECKCGKKVERERRAVKRGNTRSCGCLHTENAKKNLQQAHENGNYKGTPPRNWNNCNFKNGKKNTGGKEGKVFIPDFPGKRWSTGHFVPVEEANYMTIPKA